MMKHRVFRKAKIVATIGPASCKPHMLLALLRTGMVTQPPLDYLVAPL